MSNCPSCGNAFTAFDKISGASYCGDCARSGRRLGKSTPGSESGSTSALSSQPEGNTSFSYPGLSVMLFIIAAISLLVGVILFSMLWPGDPGYGQTWGIIAYFPAFGSLAMAVTNCILLIAIGETLAYAKTAMLRLMSGR